MKIDKSVQLFCEKYDITNFDHQQMLVLMIEGVPYREIAEIMGINEKAAERRFHTIYRKAGNSSTHARFKVMAEIYQIEKGRKYVEM